MKVSVKFRLDKKKELEGKKLPLFARISYSGKRIEYFTGYRIDLINWDADKQKVKASKIGMFGKELKVKSNDINDLLKDITSSLKKFLITKTEARPEEIKEFLSKELIFKHDKENDSRSDETDFWHTWQAYANRSDISKARKILIEVTMRQWKMYEDSKNTKNKPFKLSFITFSIETVRGFEKYLSTKKQVSRNTIHSRLTVTKGFINYAKHILEKNSITIEKIFGKEDEGYFQIKPERYGQPIYLTQDEKLILLHTDFKNQRLNQIRDIFIFQCYVGMRVGDLVKLRKSNISGDTLSYIPRKTKEGKPIPAEIPLHEVAIEILKKYDIPGGMLLPFVSEQRYNQYLKELFLIAGLNRIVTRLNPNTLEEEQIQLYKIASSHMARRTFIGQLFEADIDRAIITSMSGHTDESKAFSRYFSVAKNQKVKALSNL